MFENKLTNKEEKHVRLFVEKHPQLHHKPTDATASEGGAEATPLRARQARPLPPALKYRTQKRLKSKKH